MKDFFRVKLMVQNILSLLLTLPLTLLRSNTPSAPTYLDASGARNPKPTNTRANVVPWVSFFIPLLLLTHFHVVDEDSLAKDRVNKLRHILSPLHLCLSINCQRYWWKSTKACFKHLYQGHMRRKHDSLMWGDGITYDDPSLALCSCIHMKDANKRWPTVTVRDGLNCIKKQ